MTEREYYTNSPYVNFCKAEGYYQRLEDNESILRTHAQFVISVAGSKESITKYWKLFGDKVEEESLPSWRTTDKEAIKDFIKRIKEQNKI